MHEGKLARPLGAAVADEGQEQQGIVLEQSEVDDLVTLVGAGVRGGSRCFHVSYGGMMDEMMRKALGVCGRALMRRHLDGVGDESVVG